MTSCSDEEVVQRGCAVVKQDDGCKDMQDVSGFKVEDFDKAGIMQQAGVKVDWCFCNKDGCNS